MTAEEGVMATGPNGPTYANYGAGPQFNTGHVHGDFNYIQQHVRERVMAHALDAESVGRLLDGFVWTAPAKQAVELLQTGNSVALTGPPGSGRWTTAVAAISQAGAAPHRIDFAPEDARRDLPVETGCGYIVDIDEETIRDNPGIGEILAGHRPRLATAGAFLVVTVTAGAWMRLHDRTSFKDVAIAPPSALEIFRKRLTRAHLTSVPHWAWDSRITGLLEDASPEDAVRLAALVSEVLTAGSDNPVEDTLEAYNNWSADLAAWFGKNSDAYHRALLIAAAALGEARTETVFGAATRLADLVSLVREPGGGLAGDGVTGLIGTIDAKQTSNGRIRLRRAAYSESVLDLVWRERPHLRAELRQWLTGLPMARGFHDPATENAGHSLIGLAIRQSDDILIRTAASSWAVGGYVNLAAAALTEAALSASIGRAIRRQMYSWANTVTTDPQLKLTIATVCGGPFGENYPRNAMTRLRRLAIRGDSDVWNQVAVSIKTLAGKPHLYMFTLREVIGWLSDDRLRNAGIRSFLALADSLASQLSAPPGQEERDLLTSGWRTALHDPDHAEEAKLQLADWLEAVAQGHAPLETVLTILADTCQNSLDVGTLCFEAATWSQNKTEPSQLSRYDIAAAFLKLAGTRDPLAPGLAPTPIQPSTTEETDQ